MGQVAAVPILGVLNHAQELSGKPVADLRESWREVPADVQQDQTLPGRSLLQVGHGLFGTGEAVPVESVAPPVPGGFPVRCGIDALGFGKQRAHLCQLGECV